MQGKTLKQFDERIDRIKTRLAALGPMRPGTLSRQYRQPQQRRGGYYQISYTYRMKSRTEYLRPSQVKTIRQEIAEYQRFKKLTAQWVELALRRSQRQMKLTHALASKSRAKRID
jgi:hypothetical protein